MASTAPSTVLPASLRLLGEPVLHVAGAAPHALERKDAALLALLAIDGPVPRGRAAALLWPDADDEAARNNLRQRLHRLRKRAGFEVIGTTNDVLRLADEVEVDLRATGRTAVEAAPDAEPIAPGDLLGTLDYADCTELNDWIVAARERRRAERRDALAAVASRMENDGQLAQALRFAQRLVADDPLLEHAHRRVMRLHYLRGDRAAALAAFERCRDVLARELGARPGRETLDLAALVEASGTLPRPAAAPRPVATVRPPRLIGRETQWHVMEQAWAERRIVMVTGEPGIGKTRLLTDFAATRDALVVGARPGDAHVPHALLARLLRALLARQGAPAEGWARRELARLVPEFEGQWVPVGDVNSVRLAQAVHRMLEEPAAASLGLVLDDLQFADAESLQVLPLVARGHARWLFGARAHEVPAAVGQWWNPKDAPDYVQIVLEPLSAEGVERLLASLELAGFDVPAWAPAVFRHTGGNPMFILETLRSLLQAGPPAADARGATLPLPTSVGHLIEQRLARLGPDALQLARVAALAGEDFGVELAAHVLHRHPLDLAAAWQELEQAHVIRQDGFAHDLVLEATQRGVPAPIAQAIHASIAQQLAAQDAAPLRVALHRQAARQWQQASRDFQRAALEAGARSRRAEELKLLRSAAHNLDQAAVQEGRFDIELRSARAALLIDRTDQARAFAGNALACAPNDADRVEAMAVCAEAEEFLGQGDRAVERATEGLQRALELDQPALVLTHAGLLGRFHGARGERERALGVFDAHARWLDTAAQSQAARQFLIQQSLVLDQFWRREEAARVAQRALDMALGAGDASAACLCHTHLAAYCVRLGRKDETLRHLTQAVALREELGEAGGQTEMARVYLGVWMYQTGRYREALECFTTAHQRLMLGHATPWAIVAHAALARVYVTLGQPARAVQLLEAVPPGLPAAVHALSNVGLARALRALGRPRAHLIAESLELFRQHRQFETDLMARLQQVLDSEPAQGAELAAQVEAEAVVRAHRPLQLDAQAIGGNCRLRTGQVAAAMQLARAALNAAQDTITWTTYLGEIYWWAYEAFDAGGDSSAALDALRTARDWVTGQALPNVPEEFRDSFLHRNPVNRSILTTAGRRLGAG
jgi:DNA-binding SARP family transcriptional activator